MKCPIIYVITFSVIAVIMLHSSVVVVSAARGNDFFDDFDNPKTNFSEKKFHYLSANEVQKKNVFVNEFGVWVHTKYDGFSDEIKLDIDLMTFRLMLNGGGWKYYSLSLGDTNDTIIGLQFVRTKIFLESEKTFVDVVETQFTMETQCDTTCDFEVSLEVRFPFSLLEAKSRLLDWMFFMLNYEGENKCNTPLSHPVFKWLQNLVFNNVYEKHPLVTSESYFCMRLGFFSPDGETGPNRVETRFFFGRNSLWDPCVFRFKITPYELDQEFPLTFNSSYLTVDDSGNEAFYRTFSVKFEPAAELQITSIPGEGKISYDFGSSSGRATKISFQASGGFFSGITQSFIIDPLPSYMAFDLTVLGERSFKYESDSVYDVTYIADSVQEGNLVTLELTDLPKEMIVRWGLWISLLSQTAKGLIDLDMSSDISRVALSLYGSEKPFIEIANFPQKLRLDGYLDIPNLRGYVSATKYSGASTTISVPLRYDKWEVTGTLTLYNGYGYTSFDLPSEGNNHVALGLDTNDTALFGITLSVFDTELEKEVLSVDVDAIATDDLFISFDCPGGAIENLQWSGRITELIDLIVSIDFQGAAFDLSGSWTVGESGFFELQLNTPVEVTFADIENNEFKLQGFISLNENSFVKIEWEWGQTGYFMVYTREPIGDQLYFEVGYGAPQNGVYQYGLKINATDFFDIKRTVMWDTENGQIPRIWILGDKPFPGEWDVWLLWNYEWYEVT